MKNLFKRKSNILLIPGCILLAAGVILSLCELKEAANYVLVAGVIAMFLRGLVREREQDPTTEEGTELANEQEPSETDKE